MGSNPTPIAVATLDLRKTQSPAIPEPNLFLEKIAWHGPLVQHAPDSRAVWVVAFVLWVIAALTQYFQHNIITTVFFALLGLMVVVHAKKKPPAGPVELGPLGIRIGERLYRYRDLRSFWVDFQPGYNIRELSLHSRHWYLPYVKLPIAGQNPVQIRALLLQFIPEVEHVDTLADTIARRLGI